MIARMENWVIALLGTFGVGFITCIFGFGRYHQKLTNVENSAKKAHDRITDLKSEFKEIKETIDENNGYLKALVDNKTPKWKI